MKYIRDLYIADVNEALTKAGEGEIFKMDINKAHNAVTIHAAYPTLIRRNYIFSAQKYLQNTLSIARVHIIPHFHKDLFIEQYFSQVILEAKYREPVLQNYLHHFLLPCN